MTASVLSLSFSVSGQDSSELLSDEKNLHDHGNVQNDEIMKDVFHG